MKLVDVNCERCQSNMNITKQYNDKLSDMLESFKHKQDYTLIVTCPACDGEFVALIECNTDEYIQISKAQIALLCNVSVGDRGVFVAGDVTGSIITGDLITSEDFVGQDKTVVYHRGDTIEMTGDFQNSEVTINGKKY